MKLTAWIWVVEKVNGLKFYEEDLFKAEAWRSWTARILERSNNLLQWAKKRFSKYNTENFFPKQKNSMAIVDI